MKKLALLLAVLMLLPLMFACDPKVSEESVKDSSAEESQTTSETVSGEESMAETNYVDEIERHPTTIVKKDDSTYVITT